MKIFMNYFVEIFERILRCIELHPWTHLSASAGRESRYDVAASPSRASEMGLAVTEGGADPVAKALGILIGVGPVRLLLRDGPN